MTERTSMFPMKVTSSMDTHSRVTHSIRSTKRAFSKSILMTSRTS